MKNFKQLLSLVLLLAMFLSLGTSAFAADLEAAAEESGYGSIWDDWDDAPADDPADEPIVEEPVVEEPVAEEPVEEPAAEVPAVEEPVVDAYPENSFFYVGGSGLRVTVEAPEGAFPADAQMTVTELKTDDVQRIVDASGVEGDVFVAADISFSNAEGELQPLAPVTVRISSSAAAEAVEPRVIHIDDDDNVEVMEQLPGTAPAAEVSERGVADDCTLCFEAYSFSTYAIIGTAVLTEDEAELEFNAPDGSYTVKVSYTAESEIPSGTVLTVYEVTEDADEYAGILEDVDAALNAELDPADFDSDTAFMIANVMRPCYQVDEARVVDISLVYNGVEIEPAVPVKVEIIFADALAESDAVSAKVVHFAKSGTEVIDDVDIVKNAGGELAGVVYEQGSFSRSAVTIVKWSGDPNTANQPNPVLFPEVWKALHGAGGSVGADRIYIRYGDYNNDGTNEFQIKDTWNNLWPGDPGYGVIGTTTYISDGEFHSNTTLMEIIEGFNTFVFCNTGINNTYASWYKVAATGITFIMDATYQVDATTEANAQAHLVAQAGSGNPASYFIYTGATTYTPDGIPYHGWSHCGDSWGIGTGGTSCEWWRSISGKDVCIQRGSGMDDPLVRVVGSDHNFVVFEGVWFDNLSSNATSRVSDGTIDPAIGVVPNIAPVCVECDGTGNPLGLFMMYNGAHITDTSAGSDKYGTGVRIVGGGSLEMFKFGNSDPGGCVDSYIANMAVAVEQVDGKTRLKTSVDPFSSNHGNEVAVALSLGQSIGKWYQSISGLGTVPIWLRHVADWKSGDIVMTSGYQIHPTTSNPSGVPAYVIPADQSKMFFMNAAGIQTMMGLEYYLGPGNGVPVGSDDPLDIYGVIRFITGTVLNTRTGLWYPTLYSAIHEANTKYIQPVTGNVPIPASFLSSGDTLVFYGSTREDKNVTIPANMVLDIRSSFANEHTNDIRSGDDCEAHFVNGMKLTIPASSTVTFGGNKTTNGDGSSGTVSTGAPGKLGFDGNGNSQNLITNNGTLWLSENAIIERAADYGVYQNGTFHLNGGKFGAGTDANGVADVFLVSTGAEGNSVDDTLPGTVNNHVVTLDVHPASGETVVIDLGSNSNYWYHSRNVVVSGASAAPYQVVSTDPAVFTLVQTASQLSAKGLSYGYTALDDTQGKPVLELKEAEHFYVYHSSNCQVEKIYLTDSRVDQSTGKFNLYAEKASGTLYGGYFCDYGGKSLSAPLVFNSSNIATDTGATNYVPANMADFYVPNTNVKFWNRADAAKVLRGGTGVALGIGTDVVPQADDWFFLKEVPADYLKTKIYYVYDSTTGQPTSGEIEELYFLTAIDDNCYTNLGFHIIQTDKTAKLSARFTFSPKTGGTSETIQATSFDSVVRGYVGSFRDNVNPVVAIQVNNQFSSTPFWTTLDGIKVMGTTSTYKFNSTQNGGLAKLS